MESEKISAFRKFNRNHSQHANNRTILVADLSAFLEWEPEKFAIENAPDNLQIVEFFRKLNDILLTDNANCDYHWIVFQVIQIAMGHEPTKQYLIEAGRIITGISNYAVRASPSLIEEKQLQVWTLLDAIIVGMTITFEETHLVNLIEYLARSVKLTDTPKDIHQLQVSILSNLCFKNDVAVACLMRYTKSKELLNAIHEDVVFWCKLAMAMARYDSTMFEFELVYNLKRIFDENHFVGLMRCNDQRLVRNILDMLLVGFDRDKHSRHIMRQFHFEESIGRVLTLIDKAEIDLKHSELIRSFLGIVDSILTVSNTSLEPLLPRLFRLVTNGAHKIDSSPEAIKTLRLVVASPSIADLTASNNFIAFLVRLINETQSPQNDFLAEAFQLLIQLLAKYPTVLDQIPKNIIHRSFDTERWCFTVTDVNLPMQIHRLHWLFVYTDYSGDDTSLRAKLTDALTNKEVHYIFACGLRSSDKNISALTMELIRNKEFPIQSVSKV